MQVSPSAPPEDKAAERPTGRDPARIRAMFDALAPRYDLFNDVLSLGVHRRWRARAVDALGPSEGRRYLDVCAGTLDLACLVAARSRGARVAGADFSLPMLRRGRAKSRVAPGTVWPVAADALSLPFPDRAFAGCTIGFGLRNLADWGAGLWEIARVVEPGGRLVVLEFTTPPGRLFRAAYHGYFHHVLPRLGAWIAGDPETSRYLPDSVARFPTAPALAEMMRAAGFAEVRWALLTGGIAALHTGVRE